MSDLVAQADALLAGTTEGPWRVASVRGNREYSPHYGVASHEWNHPNVVHASSNWEGFGNGSSLADATFIAAARELVPAMAAEIERLESLVGS